jgi:polyhydroxyalkanoate synthesis regulator phasin
MFMFDSISFAKGSEAAMAEETKHTEPFDLSKLIEKSFLMGIGVLELGREKSSELADELVERGKMSKSDAKEVAEKIGDIAEKQQEVMRHTVSKETDRAMKTAGMATKKDVEELRSEMAEIKELLKKMAGESADEGAAAE